MSPSQRLVDYIKGVEKFTTPARHLDGDRPNVITGGYGFTDVFEGQEFTPDRAEETLRKILATSGDRLLSHVRVPLTQGQFDALVDFVYNIGWGDPYSHPPIDGLLTSHLLKYINERRVQEAALEFSRWNRAAGYQLLGLTRRRKVEQDWFLEVSDVTIG